MSVIENQVKRQLPDDLYRLLNHSSAVVVIEGQRGTGKTDFSLKLAEDAKQDGCISHIATNIHCEEGQGIKHIDNMPDLEHFLKFSSGRKLFILDEAGAALPSNRWMSALSVKMLATVQLIRHYKGRIFFIAPSKDFIVRHLQNTEIMDCVIEKKGLQVATVKNYLTKEKYNLYEIPGTSVKFSQMPSFFTLDKPLNKDNFNDWERDLYAYAIEGKSFKQIAEETGRFPTQVKRSLVSFGQHYFKKLKH